MIHLKKPKKRKSSNDDYLRVKSDDENDSSKGYVSQVELSEFGSNQSRLNFVEKAASSSKETGPALRKMKTYSKAKYKDALEPIHVVAYAIGHLANDLVISIWQQYSALYMIETIQLSEYEAGLIVLGG